MAKKKEVVATVLVPSGNMVLYNDKGGTLELIQWNGEPTVLVDGQYLLSHTMLINNIRRGIGRADD